MKMPFSKTAHIDIIEQIAKGMKESGAGSSYLELGISKAKCFNRVAPYFEKRVAVDINDVGKYIDVSLQNDITRRYIGKTDDFFAGDSDFYNLIFIDASHHFEDMKRDFLNAYKSLYHNGLIIIHDTFAPNSDFAEHCLDSYKIIDFLSENNYEAVTLPFYYGLTIVREGVLRGFEE